MNFKFFLITLFSLSSAWAFDKDLKTISDKVPLEFNLLFDSMKLEIKTPSEKIRMIGLCKDINDNLGSLNKEHIYMLMKTEMIKGTMEYKFSKVRQFDMNLNLISRLEEDFKTKKGFLNSFSKWIWQSIIAELYHRKSMGLISNGSFNPGNFDGQKRIEAQRFQKYLNYLFPWIDKMDSLEAAAFNKLSKEVGWSLLERLNDRSLLFKRYASTAAAKEKTVLINIPQKLLDLKPEEIKSMQNDSLPATLSEQSKKEKSEASQQMDQVTPSDMSTLSDDISEELKKKTEAPQ